MISILIVYTVDHGIFKFLYKELFLLKRYDLECLLHNSASIHRFSQFKNIPEELFSQGSSLLICAIFEKFLYNIVAKDVIHKWVGLWEDLCKNELLLLLICHIVFLLNKSRAILIHRALDDMIFYLFNLDLLAILYLVPQVFQKLALCLLYNPTRHTLILGVDSVLVLVIRGASAQGMLMIKKVRIVIIMSLWRRGVGVHTTTTTLGALRHRVWSLHTSAASAHAARRRRGTTLHLMCLILRTLIVVAFPWVLSIIGFTLYILWDVSTIIYVIVLRWKGIHLVL